MDDFPNSQIQRSAEILKSWNLIAQKLDPEDEPELFQKVEEVRAAYDQMLNKHTASPGRNLSVIELSELKNSTGFYVLRENFRQEIKAGNDRFYLPDIITCWPTLISINTEDETKESYILHTAFNLIRNSSRGLSNITSLPAGKITVTFIKDEMNHGFYEDIAQNALGKDIQVREIIVPSQIYTNPPKYDFVYLSGESYLVFRDNEGTSIWKLNRHLD